MARMLRIGLVVSVALALVCAAAAPGARRPPLPLRSLHVTNGSTRFAGDRRLLTTVSPNGDGFRDRALVRFRLNVRARVTIEAVRTDTIREHRAPSAVVWRAARTLPAGPRRLIWRP